MAKRSFKFEAWTPELAYVIGAYLGDGWLDLNQRYGFGIGSIDKEFIEKVKSCLTTFIKGNLNEIKQSEWNKQQSFKNNTVWKLTFTCKDFVIWLKDSCSGKEHVPINFPKDNILITTELINGFMDAEGYISMNRNRYGKLRFQIGVCCCDSCIFGIIDLCSQLNLLPWKCYKHITKSGRVSNDFRFHVNQIAKSPINFSIERKQKRLVVLRKAIFLNDFTLSDKDLESLSMIKSGLIGDDKRRLEISRPLYAGQGYKFTSSTGKEAVKIQKEKGLLKSFNDFDRCNAAQRRMELGQIKKSKLLPS